jgi:hypothetical protein
MSTTTTGPASWRWTIAAMVLVAAFFAAFVRVGGDWDWLVAMGDHVRATRSVPDSVPFAEADTSGWHNVPVLAEVLASLVHDLGAPAAVYLHLVLSAVALTVLAVACRQRGASDAAAAWALAATVLGGLAAFGVVRAQTLSLVPFALLVALLARQSTHADRKIWLAVPLIALWGNLHGAALLGTCVLGAHLLFGRLRRRPLESIGVGVAALAALCVTPQGWRTPVYYATVFDNVAAQRGEGLWARPSIGEPLDVLMLIAGAGLAVGFLRVRRPLWEYVAVAGLVVATFSAARHGVWLVVLLAVLSARPAAGSRRRSLPVRTPVALAVLASAVALPLAALRGDDLLGARPADVAAIAEVAGAGVVLAPAPLSEALSVAGVTLWAGNPLDAFSHEDQAAYLDFLSGAEGLTVGVRDADLVVTQEGSPADEVVAKVPGLRLVDCPSGWLCRVHR